MAAPAGAWRSKTAAARAFGTGPPATAPGPKPAGTKGAKPAVEQGSQAVDERLLFVANVLIGYTVQVQTKSGVVHEGIFHALHPAGSDFDVLLRMAKPRRDAWADDGGDGDGEWQPVRPVPLLTIPGADLVQITAVDVRMGPADVGGGGAAWDDAGGFGTDAAISRSRGNWGRERELQRWAPDEGEASQMLHLEESVGPVSRGWDQFAVNEAKFGVRTDYAEELYTTELNPSKSRISVAEAARIAAEIERGDHTALSANVHQLEERGVAIDDSQMDEEDRYGAVVREPVASGRPGTANGAGGAAAAPRPNAWAQGRPRPLLPGAAPSAPIAIDMRREANKLRAQMTSGVKQTSPYGTPNAHKRPSPLSSPLISDPSKLEALNLNPGVPRVDEQTRREFEQFKAQQAASKGSGADLFKKQDLNELRQFSHSIEGKLSRSLGKDSSMPAASPLAAAAAAAAAAPAAAAAGETAAAAAPAAGGAEQPAAAAAAAPAAAPAGEEAPKKTALNPFAKSFSFNPSAKEFKPTFTPAAAPVAAPAAAALPAAAAPGGGAAPEAAAAAPEPAAAGGAPAAGAAPLGAQFGPGAAGPGFKQGPASPLRGPMQPQGIPGPDVRPDFRRSGMEGGPPHPRLDRDSSFGRRRRDESGDRGGGFDRRRDGRHYDGGPGMRLGDGPPPPPPGKGPGGPGMQMYPGMVPMQPGMAMAMGPGGMPMGPGMQGMVPVMVGPGGQPMFMVRPMGPGQQGMVPMQPGMMPGMQGMQPGMMMFPPGAMGGSPGSRPMMMHPQMMMPMAPGMMPPGMFPPGAGGPQGGPGGPGGKGGPSDDRD